MVELREEAEAGVAVVCQFLLPQVQVGLCHLVVVSPLQEEHGQLAQPGGSGRGTVLTLKVCIAVGQLADHAAGYRVRLRLCHCGLCSL